MSDGAGYISLDLARQVPRILNGLRLDAPPPLAACASKGGAGGPGGESGEGGAGGEGGVGGVGGAGGAAAEGEGSAPLATQMRLFREGDLSKGLLTSVPSLPTGMIVLRRSSMVKVRHLSHGSDTYGPTYYGGHVALYLLWCSTLKAVYALLLYTRPATIHSPCYLWPCRGAMHTLLCTPCYAYHAMHTMLATLRWTRAQQWSRGALRP